MGRSLPYMQFYPTDWLSEPSLREVSHEAKGVWMDMLCLMWNSPVRGELRRPNGELYRPVQLARAIGYIPSHSDVTLDVTLAELVEAQVCSLEDGVYKCRRMCREQRAREGAANRKRNQRAGSSGDVTEDVTDVSRSPSQNVTVTDTEAETDTETETDTEGAWRPSVHLDFTTIDEMITALQQCCKKGRTVPAIRWFQLVRDCREDLTDEEVMDAGRSVVVKAVTEGDSRTWTPFLSLKSFMNGKISEKKKASGKPTWVQEKESAASVSWGIIDAGLARNGR